MFKKICKFSLGEEQEKYEKKEDFIANRYNSLSYMNLNCNCKLAFRIGVSNNGYKLKIG
jgi:hypothetical protein